LAEDARLAFHFARHQVIGVAPDPSFARLDGTDQWMGARMEMLGGVLVLGGVATPDVAADQAEPKVNPGIAGFEAIFTTGFGCVPDLNLIQMPARALHSPSVADPGAEGAGGGRRGDPYPSGASRGSRIIEAVNRAAALY
jgi:hypothetical protein